MGNIVAIVGRPNVGKSTLFNRLTGTRQAIVNEEAGTTRDRQYGKVEWTGKEFSLIDTGGWVVNSEDVFEEEINKQVKVAIEEADVILFVVDVLNGITDLDMEVAQILRRCKRPVIVVANKADNYELHPASAEFYSFGLGDPFCISAINGSYTGDLLDKIVATLPEEKVEILEEELPRIAIIGRPNAGKSSLINAFIGEDRHIVTDIAGTTRDSIYTKYNKFGLNFYLVDTAGIRKKGKVNEDLEYYSVIRSIRAIENSDVCVLMLDATRGIESQDMNIFSLVQKNKKGLVVCVNKWDLVEDKSQKVIDSYTTAIRERLAPFTDFPILFISALTKQRILKVLETAKEVYENRSKRVPTAKLNEVMLPIIENYPPPAWKGKYIKIKYITQLPAGSVPSFVFFCNLPQWIKDPYKRFLENKIRENWDFTGTPISTMINSTDNVEDDEIAGGINIGSAASKANAQRGGSLNIAGNLDVTEEDTKNLSESIKKLSGAAEQISKMAELTEATQKYLEQLSGMSENMERFSQVTNSLTNVSDTLLNSYKSITDNSDGINQNSRGYVHQMEQLNRNVSGLNTIYEIQLKSISSQIESIEHINSGLNRIREMYDGSVVDSSVFRNETEKMTRQLAELNQVYSRLLQAMTVNMGYQQPAQPQQQPQQPMYQQPQQPGYQQQYQQPYGYQQPQQAPYTNNPMK